MKQASRILLDDFCIRQFEAKAGSLFINYDK